ncbi:septum formation initiator family protein [bacterium]|nr:septum formation initiator family protein [bacterium]
MRKANRQYSTRRNYVLKVPGTGRVWWGIMLSFSFVLISLLLLMGEKSFLKVITLYRERILLASQIEDIETNNKKLTQQIEDLKKGPNAVERIAREELGMVRQDEIVYRFVSPAFYQKKRHSE